MNNENQNSNTPQKKGQLLSEQLRLKKFSEVQKMAIIKGEIAYSAREVEQFLQKTSFIAQAMENDIKEILEQIKSFEANGGPRVESVEEKAFVPLEKTEEVTASTTVPNSKRDASVYQKALTDIVIFAEERAQRIIQEAEEQASKTVSDAKAQAETIIERATHHKNEVVEEADRYKKQAEEMVKIQMDIYKDAQNDMEGMATHVEQIANQIRNASKRAV